jgi:hypothetical protein
MGQRDDNPNTKRSSLPGRTEIQTEREARRGRGRGSTGSPAAGGPETRAARARSGEVESENSEPEVQVLSALEIGASRTREDLETDGPVMGGPGMVRTGTDRAVGAGTGGLAAGEDLDPVVEGDYWRENFRRNPYRAAETESQYEPAYRFGWERAGQSEYRNRGFEEVELDLRREWEESRGEEELWEDVRDAARHAWETFREEE